jgi:hypothetical protein
MAPDDVTTVTERGALDERENVAALLVEAEPAGRRFERNLL